MKQYSRPFILIILIFFSVSSVRAADVGLFIDQTVDYNAHGTEFLNGVLDYPGIIIPHISALLGDNGEIIISAGLNYRFEPLIFVPELLLTELTMRFGMCEIKIGRMPYTDPMGIIAEGFFDGASLSYDTKAGTFSAGGWYTGFLYKSRAAIAMTEDERQSFYKELDYSDFMNTYFAPSRVLSALSWEHPSVGGLNVKIAALGQFDFTEADLNSQYFTVKIAIPSKQFLFDIGGCFELIEEAEEFRTAMAAGIGLTWMLPSRFEQHFSLRGLFSSGVFEDISISAFLPLTDIPQGNLLKTKLSGLSIISLSYMGRLHHTLSMDMNVSFFVRSDLGTYTSYPVIGVNSDGFLLGTELFWRFLWGMSSNIQMDMGAGVFMPSLGNAAPSADMLWRTELSVIFSLF